MRKPRIDQSSLNIKVKLDDNKTPYVSDFTMQHFENLEEYRERLRIVFKIIINWAKAYGFQVERLTNDLVNIFAMDNEGVPNSLQDEHPVSAVEFEWPL